MRTTRLLIILIFPIVVSFQACTNEVNFSSAENLANIKPQNGEPYKGKPDPFDLVLPNQQCTEVGANGRPLPNSQIYIFASGSAQLVRENCVDITPRDLTANDYIKMASGDVIYQNQTFTNNVNQGDFDVLAATCPAGKTLLANPVRKNLLNGGLNFLSPRWQLAPGTTVTFDGSMYSLPGYKIEVVDPTQAQWNGVAQTQNLSTLSSAETYVFSFYIKTSATEKLHFAAFFYNNHDLDIEFDLLTGASRTIRSTGATILSTKAQMIGGNLYINIYYRLLVSSSSNMGINSQNTVMGSQLTATAIQLEQLSNFCAP
jgi:hypothetical protein